MTVQDFGFIICKNNLIIEVCVHLNMATECLVLLPLRSEAYFSVLSPDIASWYAAAAIM